MMKGTLNLVLRFKEHVIDFRLFTLDIFDVVRSVILVYLRGNYIILGGIVRGVLWQLNKVSQLFLFNKRVDG